MFVVDDILAFPTTSLMFLFREIHNAALEELRREAADVRERLSKLYLELEAGRIGEDEFDAAESELLDRLDALEEFNGPDESDDESDNDPAAEMEDDA
jgi:hypothetical protein